MFRKLVFGIFYIFSWSIYSQQLININPSSSPESVESLEYLVENILISGACSNVSNIYAETYGLPTDTNNKSYGYFKKNPDSDFPFEEGIIMSTGKAYQGGNIPIATTISSNLSGAVFSDSDPDLEYFLGYASNRSHDKTFVEFDFIPVSTQISFRFLMASEEYDGNTECRYADGFAFLLRPLSSSTYVNLAVLPDGTPVSVKNINNASACLSHPEYFAGYNFSNPPIVDTNYGGRTIPLVATARVIPYQTYHIKLVLADKDDSVWDTAIFLEAGSFNLGVNLGEDRTLATNNAVCGDTYVLDAGAFQGATYQWFFNGNLIAGAVGQTYEAESDKITNGLGAGTYKVDVFMSSTCTSSDEIILEFVDFPSNTLSVSNPFMACDDNGDGFYSFDLSLHDNIVLNGQDPALFEVVYYASTADRSNNISITSNFTNSIPFTNQTVYAQVQNKLQPTCLAESQFDIEIFNTPIANPVPDIEFCDDTTIGSDVDGLHSFDLNTQTAGILGIQSSIQYNVSYHLSQSDADNDINPLSSPYNNVSNPQTIFTRIENVANTLCFNTTSFTLIVHPLPIITSLPVALEQCDDDIDGWAPFNLYESAQLISTDYLNETFVFYESQTDALNQTNPIPNPTTYVNPNQPTSIVWAEVTTVFGCKRYKDISLTVATTQIPPNFLIQYADCDNNLDGDDTNGVITFDLTAAQAQIEALFPNPQNLIISYYQNMTDALAEQNAITDLANYQNTNYPDHQFISVRVDSQDYNACLGLGEHIELTVYPKPVMPVTIADFEVCNRIPSYSFDLTTKDAEILNGQTNVSVTYHTSLATALAGTFPISSPYTNFSNPQMIYVRLENNTTGCFRANGTLNLVIHPTPFVNNITDYELCDDATADGFSTFYLSNKTTEILSGQTDIAVTYHLSQADANNAVNLLPDTYTNTSNPQTVYFRLENTITHCVNTGTFDLMVHSAPIPVLPTPLEVCDPDSDGFHVFNLRLKDTEIAGALAGQVSVTYHETLTDAQLGNTDIQMPTAYYNIDNWNQTIYVRVENILTGCFDVTTLDLVVNPTPQINFTPDDLEVCDDNYNGWRQVDLTQHIPEILGNVPASDVQLSFYRSQAEAWAEVNPIVNAVAYTNSSNPQTIWVRVEYSNSNCATVVSFNLIIRPLPVLTTPAPLVLCDNDQDGSGSNGFVQNFMLTDKDAEILNGQAAMVSYHFTQADAQNGTNAILSPFTNTLATVQTLWVRVTFIDTGCFALTTLDVRVLPLPTPKIPNPVTACDKDGDGFASFNLGAALIFEIQNGESGTAITFYETYQDAVDAVNPLSNPYTSISTAANSQIIYARDTYTATGCFSIVPVQLVALPTPQLTDPTDYIVCDDNYDGRYAFDLTVKTAEILGTINPATVTISYHQSQADADNGTNAIDTSALYTNLTNPQTLYVRVEDKINGCFNTVSFDLIVRPIPKVIIATPLQMCDVDPTDGLEMAYFDLESKVTEILNGQTGMIVYFFETYAKALTNNSADWLISPYQNKVNPQTIFVRIQNLNTGCFAITTLDLRVLPTPKVNYNPAPLQICDTDTDGFASFNLNLAFASITNNLPNLSVTFYEDQALTLPITPPYTNTTAFTQTIYALVTNTASPLSCKTVVPLVLKVNTAPALNTLSNYLYCEPDNNNSYLADLHEMDLMLLVNSLDLPNVTVAYYLTPADAGTGNNPLPSPRILRDGDVLYAKVTFNTTGCFSIVGPITITIEQAPQAVQPAPMVLCDDATDGDDTNGLGVSFDLATQSNTILNGQTGMSVSYYLSQQEADLEQNALTSTFQNTSNPQTIFVRVENNTTGCYNFTSFQLIVNDPPHFTLTPDAVLCLFEGSIFLRPLTDGDTYTYQWTDASGTVLANTAQLEVTQGGTYSLMLSTPEGCSETKDVMVKESQESLLTTNDLVLTNFQNNNTLTIPTGVQYGIGDYVYSVDGGPFTSNPVFDNLDGGTHTLTIVDQNGCNTHVLTFTILDYMRFFTPNGDGYNDYWNLLGGNTQPTAEIYIFDRFGKLLAQLDPAGQGWDGTFNGNPLPSTDYWFSITLEDGTIYKGHFSLVRR